MKTVHSHRGPGRSGSLCRRAGVAVLATGLAVAASAQTYLPREAGSTANSWDKPPADTPIPSYYQDSYQAYLKMKAAAQGRHANTAAPRTKDAGLVGTVEPRAERGAEVRSQADRQGLLQLGAHHRGPDTPLQSGTRGEAAPGGRRQRVGPAERLPAGRLSALVDGAVPARVHRDSERDLVDQRAAKRSAPDLHRRPRSHPRRRGPTAVGRRLDRLLGRPDAGRSHHSCDPRRVSAHAAGLQHSDEHRRTHPPGRPRHDRG